MTDFPLTRALGLEVLDQTDAYATTIIATNPPQVKRKNYVRASDLEALLAKGVRVYGRWDDSLCKGGWQDFSTNKAESKHYQAILIDIQPIKRESAEDVLLEYVEWFAKCDGVKAGLEERARRVLDKG